MRKERESCTLPAGRRMFGNEECPDSPDDKMTMRIGYRCDGGEHTFKTFRLAGLQSCQIKAVPTTTPNKNKIQGNHM